MLKPAFVVAHFYSSTILIVNSASVLFIIAVADVPIDLRVIG